MCKIDNQICVIDKSNIFKCICDINWRGDYCVFFYFLNSRRYNVTFTSTDPTYKQIDINNGIYSFVTIPNSPTKDMTVTGPVVNTIKLTGIYEDNGYNWLDYEWSQSIIIPPKKVVVIKLKFIKTDKFPIILSNTEKTISASLTPT